ncbi:hypothetical protein CPC08DRAFT_703071 [Agrocybe pediades]|nr:hypothetical protein CPC08DRAFT_703071 [Agrocybe pediades]
MFSSIIATALLSASLVKAETHLIKVGDGGLVFNPSQLTAAAGDTISFQFQAKNHSVTQSTFTDPCTPVPGGADSGFVNVPAGSTSLPQWSITVNNASAPLWFFCKQVPPAPALPHCQSGMVFAVNPTPAKTFDMFQAAAKALAGNSTSTTNSTTTTGGTTSTNGTTTTGNSSTNGTSTTGGSTSNSSDAGSTATGGAGTTPQATDGSGSTGTPSGTGAAAGSSTTPSSAMKLGGSAAGALTAVALLVSFVL